MVSLNQKILAFAASCSVVVMTVFAYILYNKRRKYVAKDCDFTAGNNLVCLKTFKKGKLERDVANALNALLTSSDASVRYGFLLMLHQSSAFTSNYAVIRDSGCLERMLKLLDANGEDSVTMRQNLVILQTVTNLACDTPNLEVIEVYLDTIFKICSTTEYSDQACAALQLLCNIALTPRGCRMLDDKTEELLQLLTTRDPYMLRQILSVLLNLSCDMTSSTLLLHTVVPDNLMETLVFALSPSVQPLVSLQAVTFLKNVYTSMHTRDTKEDRESISTVCTLRDFLLNSRVQVKLRVFLLMSEPSTSDVTVELIEHAEQLCTLLDTQVAAEQKNRT